MENKAVYVAMSMGHIFYDLLLHGMQCVCTCTNHNNIVNTVTICSPCSF